MIAPTPEQITRERKSRGLTQGAAAAIINCTRDAWAKYESGARTLNPILWQVWRIRAGLDDPRSILTQP